MGHTKSDETFVLKYKEGDTKNVFLALQKELGGTIEGQRYSVNTPQAKAVIDTYQIGIGAEMTIYDLNLTKPALIKREKDNDPDLIYLNIVTHGSLSQYIGEYATTVGQASDVGMFLYNGLLNMDIEIPANQHYHSVRIAIDLSKLSQPYRDAHKMLRTLFPVTDEGRFFHQSLSNEMFRLCTDLFHFTKLKQFKELMVACRGVEVFVYAITSFISLYEGNELQMFHKDDLSRLEGVKNDIMENIEHRYTLEELAQKYNVSASKLKRDFKKRYGIPVIQFANISRMEEAHRRLQKGDQSVSEVGYALGYSNLSKFTSMFKKTIGIMPSEVEILE